MDTPQKFSSADADYARETGFAQCVVALRRTLFTAPAGWLLVVWIVRAHVPSSAIFAWVGLFAGVWAAALWVLRDAIRAGTRHALHRRRALWVAALDGVAWGLCAWFLMGHDIMVDALLMAVLCGVCAVNAQAYVTFIGAFYLQIFATWTVTLAGLYRIADRPQAVDCAAGLTVYFALTAYHMTGIAHRVFDGLQLQHAHAALAEQLSAALQTVSQDANTDALTGQGNRRALDDSLQAQQALFDRTGQPFSILMLDIDHFKRVNDEFGHLVGDDTLRAFARRAREKLRQGDICARFGGEEFVVVLPKATAAIAHEVAERLREGIAQAPLLQTPRVCATVSIGIATCAPGQGAAALLQAADEAVYAAKSAGRNCVRSSAAPVCAEQDPA